MTPSASAASPTDFVPEVRKQSGGRRLEERVKFNLIDFGAH